MSSSASTGQRFVWRKLSPAKWEDVWQERLSWLGQRLVIIILGGFKTLRLEAHHLTSEEADALKGEFGGEVRVEKPFTAKDLEPEPRQPLRIRGRLTVVGTAEEQEALRAKGAASLYIPASLAFGTGEHATTSTCLRLLVDLSRQLEPGWEALDLGTGSGILAMAAKLFGAGRVEATDFDPMALSVAKENAKVNQIRGVVFRRSDVTKWTPDRTWPVVMANVYGPILIGASATIASTVASGGHLILSGILREQAADVIKAFRAQGLKLLQEVPRGKWVTCLTVKAGAGAEQKVAKAPKVGKTARSAGKTQKSVKKPAAQSAKAAAKAVKAAKTKPAATKSATSRRSDAASARKVAGKKAAR